MDGAYREDDDGLEISFSMMDEGRWHRARKERCCALCGDQVEGDVAVIATTGKYVVDSVVMHLRCARLSHRHCPHLAVGYTIWTGDYADLQLGSDGRLKHMLPVPERFQPSRPALAARRSATPLPSKLPLRNAWGAGGPDGRYVRCCQRFPMKG